jgi:hypothetical protein
MADDWGDWGFTEDELRAMEPGARLIMAQREHFAADRAAGEGPQLSVFDHVDHEKTPPNEDCYHSDDA